MIYTITENQLKRLTEQLSYEQVYENKMKLLKSLAPKIAQAAQKVYDAWEQDEDGMDDIYGGGGICDDIAEVISHVINRDTPFSAFGVYNENYCHTSAYVEANGDYFEVDIPPFNYEEGYGYNWKKLPNIKFSPDMVSVEPIDEEAFHHMTSDY